MGVKFKYTGDYPEGKTELTVYGCVFSPGAEVELTGRFVGKARGNRFFEEVVEVSQSAHEAEIEARDQLLGGQQWSKEDLIAMAEARGIKIDKRWSVAKLAEAIKTGE